MQFLFISEVDLFKPLVVQHDIVMMALQVCKTTVGGAARNVLMPE